MLTLREISANRGPCIPGFQFPLGCPHSTMGVCMGAFNVSSRVLLLWPQHLTSEQKGTPALRCSRVRYAPLSKQTFVGEANKKSAAYLCPWII